MHARPIDHVTRTKQGSTVNTHLICRHHFPDAAMRSIVCFDTGCLEVDSGCLILVALTPVALTLFALILKDRSLTLVALTLDVVKYLVICFNYLDH